jgi:hypothetical protein
LPPPPSADGGDESGDEQSAEDGEGSKLAGPHATGLAYAAHN